MHDLVVRPKAQFSPGPWYVTPPQMAPHGMQQVHIMAGKGRTRWGVALVGIIDPADAAVQTANARLIAAAPRLFAALEGVLGQLEEHASDEAYAASEEGWAALKEAGWSE